MAEKKIVVSTKDKPKVNADGFVAGQAVDPKEYTKFVAEQRLKANK